MFQLPLVLVLLICSTLALHGYTVKALNWVRKQKFCNYGFTFLTPATSVKWVLLQGAQLYRDSVLLGSDVQGFSCISNFSLV